MTPALVPYAVAVAAILAILLPESSASRTEVRNRALSAFLVLVLIVGGTVYAGWRYQSLYEGALNATIGFGIGALVVALADVASGTSRLSHYGVPLGLGLIGIVASTVVGPTAGLGVAAGAGLAAWLLSIGGDETSTAWCSNTAIVASVVAVVNMFGSKRPGEYTAQTGVIFGLIAAIAYVVTYVFQGRPIRPFAFGLAWIGGSWLVATRLLNLSDLWMLTGGGALVGLVLCWLIGDEGEPDTLRLGIGAMLGLSMATVAFSQYQALGMACVWMGAALGILIAGRRRAQLILGLLAAVTLYRAYREVYPDASRAFDIGQHYALIGLILGAFTPLLAVDWARSREGQAPLTPIWVVVLVGLIPISAILFGAKGEAGFLIGLGLCPVIEALRSARTEALPLVLGLSALTISSYGWFSSLLDLAREEKIRALGWVVGILFACGLIITLVSGKRQITATEQRS